MDNGHKNPIYEQIGYINDLSDPLPEINIPPSDFSSIADRFPLKTKEQIGWICPKCGSSNSPYIFSCPNCSNKISPPKYYEYPPGTTPANPFEEPKITITCGESKSDISVVERDTYYDYPNLDNVFNRKAKL